jgi:hypothetical protein
VTRLWLVIVACFVLAGCGSSDKDSVKGTVQSYIDGLGAKDGKKVCDQLATSVQAQVQQRSTSKDCAGAVNKFLASATGRQVAASFNTAKITQVNTKGNVASASLTLTVPGGSTTSTTIPLEKQGGHWRITQAAGS